MATSEIIQYFSESEAAFSIPAGELIHRYGDIVSALLYSAVFFPRFIEVDGSILLEDNISDTQKKFSAARASGSLSLAALEASFNTVEVAYLFRRDNLVSNAAEIKLASIISDAWRERLRSAYPDRIFSVSVVSPEDSGSVYTVQFFEVR